MALSEVSKFGYNVPLRLADTTSTQVTRPRHRQVSELADANGLKLYQAIDLFLQIGMKYFNSEDYQTKAIEAEISELQAQLEKRRAENNGAHQTLTI